MKGTFYGVGVGPGDPELVTLKAIRIIKECEVLALAISNPGLHAPIYEENSNRKEHPKYQESCMAYNIVYKVIPELANKALLYLPMPMTKDEEILNKMHEACKKALMQQLDMGKNVAFITLGDPSVYSTCLYVHKGLKRQGFKTKLIPGIPSFCAVAARLDMGLVENKEELHIIPASYEIEEELLLPGTKVLMKAGKKMPDVKQLVRDKKLHMHMVLNCGMENERVYDSIDEIPDDAGYYSLIVIKEGE